MTTLVSRCDNRVSPAYGWILATWATMLGCHAAPDERDLYREAGKPDLSHDFGQVLINSEHTATLTIHNSTDTPWKLREIVSGCACTVANATFTSIPPKSHQPLDLVFSAGEAARSTKARLLVLFENAPPLKIGVTAQIVRPLMLSKAKLVFSAVPPNEQRGRVIYAHNFTRRRWAGIEYDVASPWVRISCSEVAAARNANQTWRLDVTVDGRSLTPGHYDTTLTITSSSAEAAQVEIDATVFPTWYALPDSVFLTTDGQDHLTDVITIYCGEGSVNANDERLVIEHDLGDRLYVTESPQGDRAWSLKVVASDTGKSDTGTITCSCSLGTLKIPVILKPM